MKTFLLRDQSEFQGKLFQTVNSLEMRLFSMNPGPSEVAVLITVLSTVATGRTAVPSPLRCAPLRSAVATRTTITINP